MSSFPKLGSGVSGLYYEDGDQVTWMTQTEGGRRLLRLLQDLSDGLEEVTDERQLLHRLSDAIAEKHEELNEAEDAEEERLWRLEEAREAAGESHECEVEAP